MNVKSENTVFTCCMAAVAMFCNMVPGEYRECFLAAGVVIARYLSHKMGE